eukprot:838017-Prorocentrum_minimum.AAC.3
MCSLTTCRAIPGRASPTYLVTKGATKAKHTHDASLTVVPLRHASFVRRRNVRALRIGRKSSNIVLRSQGADTGTETAESNIGKELYDDFAVQDESAKVVRSFYKSRARCVTL